jgi:PAS domain S-box-containing protein
MQADESRGGGAGHCVKPGLSGQEAAEILALLPPELTTHLPIAAMGGKQAETATELVLASADLLSLCGAKDFAALARMVERGSRVPPGAHHLFAEDLIASSGLSIERLRLRTGTMTRTLTLLGRRILAEGAPPMFAGAVVDVSGQGDEGAGTEPGVALTQATGARRLGAPRSRAAFFLPPGAADSREPIEMELRRLKAAYRELSAILDIAADGAAVVDSQGLILTLNRSGEALFGYEQHEVQGQPLASLLAQECRPLALEYFEGLKSLGRSRLFNRGREVTILTRQGGRLPVFMTLAQISAAGPGTPVFMTLAQISAAGPGTPEGPQFCALLRDLSHWKNAEQELEAARKEAERANALKSAFLAKVSHEIRTPLNAILGFAEVMLEERFGPVGNPRYKDYIDGIHASGALVMSLVNDLLDLAKIEAGKMEFSFTSLDVNRVVSECAAIIQPQASREQIDTKLLLSPALPNILADDRALRQIVLNLLSNAVKFNRPGGQVVVSTLLADSGSVIVRVRDTGIGLREDDIGLAFEPFRRLSADGPPRGTGLGLPLTKALVEAIGASMIFKSKEQEGTLVEVVFPPERILAE